MKHKFDPKDVLIALVPGGCIVNNYRLSSLKGIREIELAERKDISSKLDDSHQKIIMRGLFDGVMNGFIHEGMAFFYSGTAYCLLDNGEPDFKYLVAGGASYLTSRLIVGSYEAFCLLKERNKIR